MSGNGRGSPRFRTVEDVVVLHPVADSALLGVVQPGSPAVPPASVQQLVAELNEQRWMLQSLVTNPSSVSGHRFPAG